MSEVKFKGKVEKRRLIVKTAIRYLLALLVVALLLFLPAGSLRYWNAWLYITELFIPMLFVFIYLVIKDPELLDKRLRTREKQERQKTYQKLSLVLFFVAFLLPGLDYRYRWSVVPSWLIAFSAVMVLIGYFMFVVVLKENSYASRVIEIQERQRLIDTGLYSVVRHPLYLSATILYLFSPLVLGSFYALLPMIFLPLLLAMRILNEEEVLKSGLVGYEEYMKRVKYRLVPFIW